MSPEVWFALLLPVKTAVVVLIAIGASRLLAGSRASRRHAVWVTALAVILLLPLVSLSGHRVAVPLPSMTVESVVEEAPVAKPALQVTATPASTTPGPARAVADRRDISWGDIAAAIYLSGVLAVLFQFGVGLSRARRIARRGRPVETHNAWRRALGQLSGAGGPARTSIRVTDDIAAPVAFGVFRPVVLLPADVASWSPPQLRDALVHEFSHLQRRDWGAQVAGILTCALHWYHPLVWFAARRLELEAERACDEHVVRTGADPHEYAAQLVALSRCDGAKRVRMTIAMSRNSCLSNRVHTIISNRRTAMKSNLGLTIAAVAVTAAGLLLAPLQPVEAGRSNPSRTPLMKAVVHGDVGAVARAIADGADVDEAVAGEGTPLILAATRGELRIAEMLVDAGADVNRSEVRFRRRDLMRTPLTAAARHGHRDIVMLLLDHGARIDAAPRGDATALMEAAKNDHESIVSLLIERGADVSLAVHGDGNAMIAAARSGNVEIARMIVDAGADVNGGVRGDGNALIIAVRNDDMPMVEYLLSQGADPAATVPGDENALVAAAEAGNRSLLRRLLDAE